ncbi:hypothetical protein JX265_007916 [Neoarthrinium moseri]|uniref:Uncharacterized protein n=1 Tax=Neoarthrinium moseri TaxID=1658444 RepID=A0A9P9WIU3_9PEZI|nr:hypothetical protein JX266_012478 [Neoarthrinium moseri]KAI1865593.1 hypothetical protein JX265_007916 [Neoarthrinium moseri]
MALKHKLSFDGQQWWQAPQPRRRDAGALSSKVIDSISVRFKQRRLNRVLKPPRWRPPQIHLECWWLLIIFGLLQFALSSASRGGAGAPIDTKLLAAPAKLLFVVTQTSELGFVAAVTRSAELVLTRWLHMYHGTDSVDTYEDRNPGQS